MNEFTWPGRQPYRGLTSIEATAFLKQEFPQVPHWTCWMGGCMCSLKYIVSKDFRSSGTVGSWSWKRVSTSYPVPAYWFGADLEDLENNESGIKDNGMWDDPAFRKGDQWVGVIDVRGAKGEQFMLFSFLNAKGDVGDAYYASTQDLYLLKQFARDVELHFKGGLPNKITIDVTGGHDITIKAEDCEHVVLPNDVQNDIEQQTYSFFKSRDAYKQMHLRHRRGFLFIGEPGTGKTMMVRHLIRQCHQRFTPSFFMLSIRKDTDQDAVGSIFARASRNAPAMIILEDLDSLTTESKISRSSFLTLLDGVSEQEGVLVIGTTNYPDRIDPALVHRPSRFDRVWHFHLPDYELRRKYLELVFKVLKEDVVQKLARETKNWSFAYLKELHTTASIMAIAKEQSCVTTEIALKAFDLLGQQFQDGKKNHVVRSEEPTLGFAVV